jgi:hypothetical protein
MDGFRGEDCREGVGVALDAAAAGDGGGCGCTATNFDDGRLTR